MQMILRVIAEVMVIIFMKAGCLLIVQDLKKIFNMWTIMVIQPHGQEQFVIVGKKGLTVYSRYGYKIVAEFSKLEAERAYETMYVEFQKSQN